MSQPNLCPGPPRKFLKKGEGLKRFAAYRPPLPFSANKFQRRQTFVKFNLDQNKLKEYESNFLHPDILTNDSINLSTEIPKIAPPKIMHTPVRPDRRPLAALKPSPKRYNLRRGRKPDIENEPQPVQIKDQPKRGRRQLKAVVERHITLNKKPEQAEEKTETQINGNIDTLLRKIEAKKSSLGPADDERENLERLSDDDGECSEEDQLTPVKSKHNDQRVVKQTVQFDLSTPSPGSCILALGRQIRQIQSTVNELKQKIESCECGSINQKLSAPTSKSSRKATRRRPSADADNTPPTILNCLIDEISQLRARFDEINLKKR